MRYFLVTIIDSDGDLHDYYFKVENGPLWMVTQYIASEMVKKDFYGHEMKDTLELHIVEVMDIPKHQLAIEIPPVHIT